MAVSPLYHHLHSPTFLPGKKSDQGDEATMNHQQQEEIPKIVGSEGNITAQAGNSALLNCLIENYHEDSVGFALVQIAAKSHE